MVNDPLHKIGHVVEVKYKARYGLKFYSNADTTLSFVDVRRFGKWKQGLAWSDGRGPDPTTEYDEFWKNVMTNLTKLKKPLYEMLMDQKYFNGIGNYLRAEIIFRNIVYS